MAQSAWACSASLARPTMRHRGASAWWMPRMPRCAIGVVSPGGHQPRGHPDEDGRHQLPRRDTEQRSQLESQQARTSEVQNHRPGAVPGPPPGSRRSEGADRRLAAAKVSTFAAPTAAAGTSRRTTSLSPQIRSSPRPRLRPSRIRWRRESAGTSSSTSRTRPMARRQPVRRSGHSGASSRARLRESLRTTTSWWAPAVASVASIAPP